MPRLTHLLAFGGIYLALSLYSSPAGAQCLGDLNGDHFRDATDLTAILANWGTPGGDCNGDGLTDGGDLTVLLSGWGICPGPSWGTVLQWAPSPTVVTNATLRAAIIATGLPWRMRDTATGIELLLVPPGSFLMGASPGDPEAVSSFEFPAHQVTLTQSFYLGRTEVTQAQWQTLTGNNPSRFSPPLYPAAPENPVEQVSWTTAHALFAANGLRLPTEAEFEYACRAGDTTGRYGPLNNIAWWGPPGGNAGGITHPVKGKLPNGLGFYDIIGNVCEWVEDGWSLYSEGAVTDPTGPSPPIFLRVFRSSSWASSSGASRASYRTPSDPGFQDGSVGVRVARNP